MTHEQAKSELMQIYMSLSEGKKQALDVLMAQADGEKTCGTCRNEDTYHCAECENKSDYEQAQADGEYISRQAVLDVVNNPLNIRLDEIIKQLPSVKPQESKLEQFAKWVAIEIFYEWEYNKDSFAEIACRKLARLGIVRAKGDEWELVEPQESEGV